MTAKCGGIALAQGPGLRKTSTVRLVSEAERLSFGQLAIKWGVSKQRAHSIVQRELRKAKAAR